LQELGEERYQLLEESRQEALEEIENLREELKAIRKKNPARACN
jgi:F0F1-type ATP synthase membrane subunit b/b'